jgi:signal peptidase
VTVTAALRLLRLASALFTVLSLLGFLAFVGARVAHWSAEPVLTGSMAPTFQPGDLVVTRQVDVRTLHTGQVAVFVPPGETSAYAHRVVGLSGDPVHPVIRTKGDANPAPDAWQARLTAPTVPVVVAHAPYAGRLITAMRAIQGHSQFVTVLGLILTLSAVRMVLPRPTSTRRPTRGAPRHAARHATS